MDNFEDSLGVEEGFNESIAHYAGVEPIDIGSLDDIVEQKVTIPPSKNVRVKIKKAEHQINNENTYRQISLQLQIVNGIDETGKYKNKVIFARICYYADPTVYNKDFFKNRQHLVQLKNLLRATDLQGTTIDGHIFEKLEQAPDILCDITQKKRKFTDASGTEIDIVDNEARNFKPLPIDQQI